MKDILRIMLICISPISMAGEVEDVFGEGVFDAKWGQDISVVKHIHKEAKQKSYGSIVHLELKDGRKVLGVDRRTKDKIVFGFDSEGRLSNSGVYFKSDKFGDLLAKLDTLFGPHSNKESSFGVITEWPIDNGIKISLSHITYGLSSDVVFTIENQALAKPKETKIELGF